MDNLTLTAALETRHQLPGLPGSLLEGYAQRGAMAFRDLVEPVRQWINDQRSADALGPRMLDAFAGKPSRALAETLHVALLHASGIGRTTIMGEIPEWRDSILKKAGTATGVLTAVDENSIPEIGLRWFKKKRILSPEEFYALNAAVRAQAFTISRATSNSMIWRVHQSLVDALATGDSFDNWKSRIADTFDAEGFTPANSYHLNTVFNNAMLGAYGIERFRAMNEAATFRPYWQYMTVGDEKVRDAHRKLHGRVFRYDDPFWRKGFPPNGHNCRCYARSLSERQLKAQGLKVTGNGGRYTRYISKGWDWNAAFGPDAKILAWIFDQGSQLTLPLVGQSRIQAGTGLPVAEQRPPLPEPLPDLLRKMGTDEAVEHYREYYRNWLGLNASKQTAIITDPMKCGIEFGMGMFEKAISDDPGRGRLAVLAVETVRSPAEIWQVPVTRRDGTITQRRRYIAVFPGSGGDDAMLTLVYEQDGRFVSFNFVPKGNKPNVIDKQRGGTLLWRK